MTSTHLYGKFLIEEGVAQVKRKHLIPDAQFHCDLPCLFHRGMQQERETCCAA